MCASFGLITDCRQHVVRIAWAQAQAGTSLGIVRNVDHLMITRVLCVVLFRDTPAYCIPVQWQTITAPIAWCVDTRRRTFSTGDDVSAGDHAAASDRDGICEGDDVLTWVQAKAAWIPGRVIRIVRNAVELEYEVQVHEAVRYTTADRLQLVRPPSRSAAPGRTPRNDAGKLCDCCRRSPVQVRSDACFSQRSA